ncbi:MAG TPA: class D sortase [Thermoanaerobaculia bacterium]|jgi:sortase A|nr:class D sortase [Thermoanaerobaculia bacterium]
MKKSSLRWLERALLVVALLCLGAWAYAWLDARYAQYREGKLLDEAADVRPPASVASETDALETFRDARGRSGPAPEGTLVGRIEIPRLGVSAIVLEGIGKKTLRRGVGHIPETPLPETGGNVGLAAHRDSFFRELKDIRKNDIITLKTLEGTYEYRVEWTRIVQPEDVEVLAGTGAPALTLVTCYPFYYVGSAPERFIVRAVRTEEQAASGP